MQPLSACKRGLYPTCLQNRESRLDHICVRGGLQDLLLSYEAICGSALKQHHPVSCEIALDALQQQICMSRSFPPLSSLKKENERGAGGRTGSTVL